MKCRSLLVLSAFVFAAGCKDARQPIGPRAPSDPAGIISDGAHGGNPDFFFLPPMVPPPFQDPDFDQGEFNPRLQASLEIEICTLDSNYLSADGKPLSTTPCVGPLIKTFAPGSVDLVGVPAQQSGWWSNFNLPSDGFYKVLWDTRQHDLLLDKYYRIKVLLDGSDEPLGYADVDPVANMREWRHVLTGELVTMIDDSKLPIVFRVEKGALCGEATQCGSATITNDNPNGDTQVLQVLNEGGVPVAGVLIPDGWLPLDGPQSVVVSIARVNTGAKNIAAGTQEIPCHANLPLQQFDGCFHFRTIPELEPIDESGRQFATPIIGAVCFTLADSEDPREPYVQLWSSEPEVEGDEPKPLKSADASLILTGNDGRNCGEQTIASTSSNPLFRVASAGWRKLAKGFGHAFGVKTAYAVDVGLGGILDGFSNVGPAMSAEIQRYTATDLILAPGATTTSTARVVGTQRHDGSALTTGIGGVSVTFTLAEGHGSLNVLGTTGGSATQVTVTTNTNPIDGESPTSGGGFAPVNWTLPTVPGTYTLTATGRARGGPVTFTATVPAPTAPDFVVTSGTPTLTPAQITTSGGIVTLSSTTVSNQGGSFTLAAGVRFGVYLSTDATITPADQLVGSANIPPGSLESGGTVNLPFPTGNIPSGVAAGNYFLGFLIDDNNAVVESNEGNNFVSAPLAVVAPQRMVSMQTGATIQFSATPPDVIATWLSSAPTKVQVSATGLVTAIVGGENSNGGDGATLTSVLTTGSAGPAWLVNSPFTIFPRVTTAVWVPVDGAASYDVATEFGNGCTGYANCSTWSPEGGATGIAGSSSSFTFTFVGTQPGRWRVTARDATGAIMPGSPSAWIFFRYIDGL